MLVLHDGSVKRVKVIVVRKKGWNIGLSADVILSKDSSTWFGFEFGNIWREVGCQIGAEAVVEVLGRTIGQSFKVVPGDDDVNCIYFCRRDCVEEWKAAQSTADCQA